MLTIALNKGRVLDALIPILELAGLAPAERIADSRKLIFDSQSANVRLVVIRGGDVPAYVEHGAADLGITGKDTLLERGDASGFYERLDLGIARCEIKTAAPVGAIMPTNRPLRVATKFTRIARAFYAARQRQVELIKLNGAMELAPMVGLADQIVDIVETGNTLRANGLEPLESIVTVSSRVIVNRASTKLKFDEIEHVLARLEQAVVTHAEANARAAGSSGGG